MLRKLGIPGPYQALYYTFSIYRNKTTAMRVPIIFHHGFFAGRTSSNKIINLERFLVNYPEAWGFFCGHGHTKALAPPITGLMARNGKIETWYKRAAMTGSYLRTYADGTVGYGEVKGYPPVALGHITISIAPFHPKSQKRLVISNM